MHTTSCFQISKRARALSAAAALAGIAIATPCALADVRPAPIGDKEHLTFDLARAISHATRTVAGETHVSEPVLEESEGGVRIVLEDFEFSGITAETGLTDRLSLRAAIPVNGRRGSYPSSLAAQVSLRVDKQAGVSLSTALLVRALNVGEKIASKTWARNANLRMNIVSLVQNIDLASTRSELRKRFCDTPGASGILTADFSVSAERDRGSLSYSVSGVGASALVIEVLAGPLVPCDEE